MMNQLYITSIVKKAPTIRIVAVGRNNWTGIDSNGYIFCFAAIDKIGICLPYRKRSRPGIDMCCSDAVMGGDAVVYGSHEGVRRSFVQELR